MSIRRLAVILAILAALIVGTTIAALLQSYTRQISSRAQIRSVGVNVFSDPACTQNVTSIDWGTLDPGSTTNYQAYIKSTSNVPITLTSATDSWNPASAPTYITLSWNYTAGTQIQPNAVLPVIFTLTVNSSVTGFTSFSFNINITGSG